MVVFDPATAFVGDTFYREVRINHQGNLFTDPQTVAWWDQQLPEARDRLYANQQEKPILAVALNDLNEWLTSTARRDNRGNLDVCVWGNGADFDNAILQAAYAELNVPLGWPFWNNRCYRTLKNLAPQVKMERIGVYHNALDDALSQAMHANLILRTIGCLT
jgi:exodeoxyribonuclease VIII